MASGQSARVPAARHGNPWLTTVASLTVGVAFFALWFWLLPQWLGFRVETSGHGTLAMAGSGSVSLVQQGVLFRRRFGDQSGSLLV